MGARLSRFATSALFKIRDPNEMFRPPAVTASSGGKSGGGARLTSLGIELIHLYRTIERKSETASREEAAEVQNLANHRKNKIRPQLSTM